jgi:hypothetical protein
MHMWHHVTNHLIISIDKDSNSENRIKLRVRDTRVRKLDAFEKHRDIRGGFSLLERRLLAHGKKEARDVG